MPIDQSKCRRLKPEFRLSSMSGLKPGLISETRTQQRQVNSQSFNCNLTVFEQALKNRPGLTLMVPFPAAHLSIADLEASSWYALSRGIP